VLEPLVYGLLLGGVLALAGLGFTLVYGVLDVVNLAHGVFVILGGYVSYWLVNLYGLNFWQTLPISFCVLAVFGYLYQRLLVQRVITEKILYVFVLTFGAATLFTNIMTNLWTNDHRSIDPGFGGRYLEVVGVIVPYSRLVVFLAALIIMALTHLFLQYSKMGKAIRATRDNSFVAALLGVDLKHVYASTMAIGAGTAGLAGSLLLAVLPISPVMEIQWLVYSIVVVVVGGVGSVIGTMLGGLLLGVLITATGWYLGQGISVGTALALFLAMLLFRPTGLLGIEHEIRH